MVVTVNGGKGRTDSAFWKIKDVSNIMFARVRSNTWNIENVVDGSVKFYTSKNVPVVLTFMRYGLITSVKRPEDYVHEKHVLNTYWSISPAARQLITKRYAKNSLVFTCGTEKSSFCKDCRNCETLYWRKINN